MASPLTLAFVIVAIVGRVGAQAPAGARPSYDEWKETKASEADAEAAVGARNAKMAAVNKVTQMLEELLAKVTAEGEAEAKTYDKFACFCKDTTAEKSEAIRRGEDEKQELEANIADLQQLRADLDAKIKELLIKIKETEEKLAAAEKERKAALELYEKNAADLAGAIEALEAAIATLKASKPSLVQLKQVARAVKTAIGMADALGLGGSTRGASVLALLQQDPSVPMQDYNFHSDGIIEILEKLLVDFQQQKAELDEAEVKSVHEFDMLKQEFLDVIKRSTNAMEKAKSKKEATIEEIAAASERLSTVSAQLLADKEYLMELSKMCHERAITWDQRTQVRSDELSALSTAIGIIKKSVAESTSANTVRFLQRGKQADHADIRVATAMASDEGFMESIELAAEQEEGGSPSFLQVGAQPRELISSLLQERKAESKRSTPENAREAVIAVLRDQGRKIKSTLLLKLSTEIQADHFAKVKKLIQELIERLLQEAANESNQKGFCDKATADAEQKRDYAVEEIATLNAEMARLEAEIAKLNEELEILREEIAELKAARDKATKLRAAEKAENAATVEEAKFGLDAIKMAMDILQKFYATAAKATVSLAQGPADDAPDAGFQAFEAYTGSQGAAGGIIGMMDVIKSDFERTISETEKAEAEAEKAFLEFMTETGMSLAEKTTAEQQKTNYRDSALEQLEEARSSLDTETEILQKAISELIELLPVCVDTGMSYEERVALREEEIEGLKKALCVLQNYNTEAMDEC